MPKSNLEEQIQEYQKIAKENKDVDLAVLMANALKQQEENLTPTKQKQWGYLISLLFPPFGLFFAIVFYLNEKTDGKKAALMCVILTIFSILLAWLFIKIVLFGSGADLNQIQQIKPEDIKQLLE